MPSTIVWCPLCDAPTKQAELDRPDSGYRLLDEHTCIKCKLSGPVTALERVRGLMAGHRQLLEDLLERATAADRAAALADDTFDVQARDGYRGRSLAYRYAARELVQVLEAPNRQIEQFSKSGDRGDVTGGGNG